HRLRCKRRTVACKLGMSGIELALSWSITCPVSPHRKRDEHHVDSVFVAMAPIWFPEPPGKAQSLIRQRLCRGCAETKPAAAGVARSPDRPGNPPGQLDERKFGGQGT